MELALAETAIAAQAGHTAAGNRFLTRAVSLAAPRGIVRPFADQAVTIAALVDDTRPSDWGFALAQERRFFADICRRLPISDPSLQEKLVALNMESHLLDPLTRRQIELLGLLDAGLSNQQIADRIYHPRHRQGPPAKTLRQTRRLQPLRRRGPGAGAETALTG